MTRHGLSALTIGLMLAGCQPPADERDASAETANSSVPANEIDLGNAAQNAVEPSRSILRPEVAEPEEKPPIEPASAVIAFGASPMALDDAARAALDALLATPAMAAGGQILLRGHSDSRGSDGDNRVASRRRAEAVRDYLIEKGVAAQRITLFALGETRPVAPNARDDGTDDPDGRARNRRVEVVVALPVIVPPAPAAPAAAAP